MQLSKENKKFQYSVVKKGSTASKYEGSLQWIEDAGIISRCYNLSITELPLDGNAQQDTFKVYMKDCGHFDLIMHGIRRGELEVQPQEIQRKWKYLHKSYKYFNFNGGCKIKCVS